MIPWLLRWICRLRFPRPPNRRDVMTPPPIRLWRKHRSPRRRLPPLLPPRWLARLRFPLPSQLWRSAPHPRLTGTRDPHLARCASSFRRLWARCVSPNTCRAERPHLSYLQECCDPCINKNFTVCYAQDKPQATTACESCANLKRQCKKPAFWAMNITDLSMLSVHQIRFSLMWSYN